VKRGGPLPKVDPRSRAPDTAQIHGTTGHPHTVYGQRSVKRAEQMAVYVPERNTFLTANSLCQYPEGCGQRATQVHHRRGRRGLRLLDKTWWSASCDFHNEYAETNTGHCLTIGLAGPHRRRITDGRDAAMAGDPHASRTSPRASSVRDMHCRAVQTDESRPVRQLATG